MALTIEARQFFDNSFNGADAAIEDLITISGNDALFDIDIPASLGNNVGVLVQWALPQDGNLTLDSGDLDGTSGTVLTAAEDNGDQCVGAVYFALGNSPTAGARECTLDFSGNPTGNDSFFTETVCVSVTILSDADQSGTPTDGVDTGVEDTFYWIEGFGISLSITTTESNSYISLLVCEANSDEQNGTTSGDGFTANTSGSRPGHIEQFDQILATAGTKATEVFSIAGGSSTGVAHMVAIKEEVGGGPPPTIELPAVSRAAPTAQAISFEEDLPIAAAARSQAVNAITITQEVLVDLPAAARTQAAQDLDASEQFDLGQATRTQAIGAFTIDEAVGLDVADRSQTATGLTASEALPLPAADRTQTANALTVEEQGAIALPVVARTQAAGGVSFSENFPLEVASRSQSASTLTLAQQGAVALPVAVRSQTAQEVAVSEAVDLGPSTRTQTATDLSASIAVALQAVTRSGVVFGLGDIDEDIDLDPATRTQAASALVAQQDGVAALLPAASSRTADLMAISVDVPMEAAARSQTVRVIDISERIDLGVAERTQTATDLETSQQGVISLPAVSRGQTAEVISLFPSAFNLEFAARTGQVGTMVIVGAFSDGEIDGTPRTTHLRNDRFGSLAQIDPDDRKVAGNGMRGLLSG